MLVWQVEMGSVVTEGGWNEEDSEQSGWRDMGMATHGAAMPDSQSSSWTCCITGPSNMFNENSWDEISFDGSC